jgi:uncharacterized protein
MKYVLMYGPGAVSRETIVENVEGHRELWKKFGEAGTLLMVGPFTDPNCGAMAIFTTREAAEEFAKSDPFVTAGVASHWEVQEWNEAMT